MLNETPDQVAKRVASEHLAAEKKPGVYEALPDPEKVGPIRIAQRDSERLS